MAFRFFRRRQKMVVVIMAVLMVSFLIGFQGFQRLTRKDPDKVIFGRTKKGEITYRDIRSAKTQLELLQQFVAPFDPLFEVFAAQQGEDFGITYALLLSEARGGGFRTTKEEVREFYARSPIGEAGYKQLLVGIKAGQYMRNLTTEHLISTVSSWLSVVKALRFAHVQTWPSEQELSHLCRDLYEQIDLDIVRISAADFIEDIPEPNDAAINKQFEKHKHLLVGTYDDMESFGFGYRQPDRVSILYMLTREEVIRRVVRPSEQEVRRYYLGHEDEFVEKVEIPTSEAASPTTDQAQTAPASQPVRYRTVKLTPAQARPKIVEKLSNEAISAKMDELLGRAKTLLDELGEKEQPIETKAYESVLSRMIYPADDLLDRKLQNIKIDRERLDTAIGRLVDLAGVKAICYPWGTHADWSLDPSVLVTIKAENITLREALEKITEQVKLPKLKWAACTGIDGALFSVGGEDGIDFFPITVVQTDLLERTDVVTDSVLGNCFAKPNGGKSLAELAFEAYVFTKNAAGTSGLRVGEDGPRMYVTALRPGRSLWRLAEAVPAHDPDEISPDLRERIIDDIKTVEAFKLAVKQAEEIKTAAAAKDLAEVAEAGTLQIERTGPFSRKIVWSPQFRQIQELMIAGVSYAEAMVASQLVKPVEFLWSEVPGVYLTTPKLQERFMEAAFALVPQDIEPPYSDDPPAIGLLKLSPRREVLVMQRVGYRPLVRDEYEKEGKRQAAKLLIGLRSWMEQQNWFNHKKVVERVGFTKDASG